MEEPRDVGCYPELRLITPAAGVRTLPRMEEPRDVGHGYEATYAGAL
jgi:hypothetical protein